MTVQAQNDQVRDLQVDNEGMAATELAAPADESQLVSLREAGMTVAAKDDQAPDAQAERAERTQTASALSTRAAGEGQVLELANAYKDKLTAWTRNYQKQWPKSYRAKVAEQVEAARRARGDSDVALTAEPDSQFFGIPYPWWNILVIGPVQAVAPLGPFLPSKIIRTGEDAFMIVVLWRNPLPLPGGPNPSAAQIMASYEWEVRGETINLSDVANGPDLTPVTGTFGAGFIDVFVMPIQPGTFPVPQEGRPLLYELNFVMDIKGVGPGLPPFAGYATWVLDLDSEPSFLGIPTVPPELQHDIPVRFLVYR